MGKVNTHIKIHECPSCHAKLDNASQMGGPAAAEPKEGDLTVCIYCGEWMQFEENAESVRPLPQHIFQEIKDETWFKTANEAISRTMPNVNRAREIREKLAYLTTIKDHLN